MFMFFFFKQKTAYELRISDWSSDVCSADLEKLMTEPAFRDGVELCRWEAYAGTLGDTLVLVEGHLRPDDPALREALADRIAGLYPLWLNGHVPPHRTDWTDRLDAFAARFRAARIAPPVSPDAAVQETAILIHTTVPLHDRLARKST